MLDVFADVLRVRPKTVALGAPPAAPSRDPDGRTADGAAGGVIFHGLREYVSGEDLRFVHWPSSARTGVLMVREHVEPSEPASIVVLQPSATGMICSRSSSAAPTAVHAQR